MAQARKPRTRRLRTQLRFECGAYIPERGDTIIMQHDLSRTYTAVTVHRIYSTREHGSEPGVTLMDATVTMRDLPLTAELFLEATSDGEAS